MTFDHTYVKIDLDAIARNFAAVQEKADVPVMAVIKGDAYGHGAIPIARLLQDKCAFFGVSSMAEALELRRAGLDKPILILGHTPTAAFPEAIREQIRPTIFRYEDALALSDAAVKLGATAHFHFAADTGMGRIGFAPTEKSADLCAKIIQLPGLVAEGLFSHFATADCADLSAAREQEERFAAFDAMLKARGVEIPIRHLNNSAGIMNFPSKYEMVRAGIVLYGMYPSEEVDKKLLPLSPALEWESHVTHVKTLGSGCSIGYGATFVTERPTVVATIPVGYADGYRRNLSNRFYVLIRGQKAPILGRICMDQMMVDVTDIPGVTPGDAVTLVGKNGDASITMEEIAAMADSFNYEFGCGISRRVPRFYYQNGEQIAAVHYLLDEHSGN
ncbi:MAG: alanine racemase [Ruminococcaceae bacterium]|nr:alanine racemase [Oscillospiraceae bacterium]